MWCISVIFGAGSRNMKCLMQLSDVKLDWTDWIVGILRYDRKHCRHFILLYFSFYSTLIMPSRASTGGNQGGGDRPVPGRSSHRIGYCQRGWRDHLQGPQPESPGWGSYSSCWDRCYQVILMFPCNNSGKVELYLSVNDRQTCFGNCLIPPTHPLT